MKAPTFPTRERLSELSTESPPAKLPIGGSGPSRLPSAKGGPSTPREWASPTTVEPLLRHRTCCYHQRGTRRYHAHSTPADPPRSLAVPGLAGVPKGRATAWMGLVVEQTPIGFNQRVWCADQDAAMLTRAPILKLISALPCVGVLALGLPLAPAPASAAVATFGSPLSVAASKNTANDLNYTGSNVALPGSTFHIAHDGADTALWNPSAGAPAAGQVTSVRLEGCAQRPPGAPPPLTQIHFQDLVPQPGGGVKVHVTTQPFDIPVCGENGAHGSTVTTFTPTNFCVNQGDLVDFNDEGGFIPSSSGPPTYPAGVPYMFIGAVGGSTMDSFIRNNGVGNGAYFSPGDTSYHDGFATNPGEELLLQATLATGPDATPLCPGGTHGVQPRAPQPALSPVRIGPQTVGVNHSSVVAVAIYCRPPAGCHGQATLSALGRDASSAGRRKLFGKTRFHLHGNKTAHVPIHVSSRLVALLRRRRSGVPVVLSAVVNGVAFTQTITLRIF
jgi:hypothetical protein